MGFNKRERSEDTSDDEDKYRTKHSKNYHSPEKNENHDSPEKNENNHSNNDVTPIKEESNKITNDEIKTFKELIDDRDLYDGLKLVEKNRKPTKLQENILLSLRENKNRTTFIKTDLFRNKELCYLLYAFNHINPKINKVQAIIVIPTTELINQTKRMAKKLFKYTKIKIKSTVEHRSDISKIDSHLLICSVGCLISALFKYRSVKFEELNLLIFDFLDLLINSNTNCHNIHKTISNTRNETKLVMFASSVTDFALNFVKDYASHKFTYLNYLNKNEVLENIKHYYVKLKTKFDRFRVLLSILERIKFKKIIIFTLGKNTSYFIYKELCRENYRDVMVLSNELGFTRRLDCVDEFKSKKSAILLTNYPLTINLNDFDDVSLIINYDLLKDGVPEYYHKISFLGRFGKKGYSINFIYDDDEFLIDERKKIEKECDIRIHELDTKKEYDFR